MTTIAARNPTDEIYTFCWPRHAGLRIDHVLLAASIARLLKAAEVDRVWRGLDGASDRAGAGGAVG